MNVLFPGLPMYSHSGTTWGASSLIMIIPSKRLGVFIAMTGRDNDYLFRTTALTHIADLYLGETPWISATDSCSWPFSQPQWADWTFNRLLIKTDGTVSRPLADFTGSFVEATGLYGDLSVVLSPGDGLLHLTYGWADFILYPRKDDDNLTDHVYPFYMKGQGDLLNVINFSECLFSGSSVGITEIQMTKWEGSDVPVFVKSTV